MPKIHARVRVCVGVREGERVSVCARGGERGFGLGVKFFPYTNKTIAYGF